MFKRKIKFEDLKFPCWMCEERDCICTPELTEHISDLWGTVNALKYNIKITNDDIDAISKHLCICVDENHRAEINKKITARKEIIEDFTKDLKAKEEELFNEKVKWDVCRERGDETDEED